MLYQPKPGQFQHQKDDLELTWDKPGWGKFWEQGTGKTRDFVDTGGALYCEKAINGIFLLAPNGLHRQFIERELPKHMPEEILERARAMFWRTAQTKRQDNEARELIAHDDLRILGMSYDSIMTEPGRKLAKEFLMSTTALYGIDESQRIKEPGASRTIRVLASSRYGKFRRALSGTPIANAPWDCYTQIKFVDSEFWKPHGLDDIGAMRSQFGEWEKGFRYVSEAQAKWPSGAVKERLGYKIREDGRAVLEFPRLATAQDGTPVYKNLEKLQGILTPIRTRILKDDVFDLPPKLYSPLEFDLSPPQRRAYDSLRKLGFLISEGRTVTASMALTVLLRLQQIACGYLVTDLQPGDDDEPHILPITPNPRIEAMLEKTEDIEHQGIIWGRFHQDIDAICAALKKQGKTFARYDGTISDDEAAYNEERFHKGDAQWFVSNPAKGGEGLTLVEARTVIYYSNSFKLIERLQSEDRPHRWGQLNPVNYIDLIARDTVDVPLIHRLHSKMDVASIVMGDSLREWLKI